MTDRNRRKINIQIAIFLTFVILLLLCLVHGILKMIYISPSSRAQNFNKYRGDLRTACDILWDEYIPQLKADDSISYIRIYPSGDEISVTYVFKDSNGESKNERKPMNEELAEGFNAARKVLPSEFDGYGTFSEINISGNQIAFVRCGAHYALVYSKYWRPDCISDDKGECFVDRISFGWYQVVNKNRGPGKGP